MKTAIHENSNTFATERRMVQSPVSKLVIQKVNENNRRERETARRKTASPTQSSQARKTKHLAIAPVSLTLHKGARNTKQEIHTAVVTSLERHSPCRPQPSTAGAK